ncbi:DUF11 domain-containing protein [Streptomyces sp. NBC_00690]|uniref:DUF11 domain-containing protein n=1 Tax=Streptomyces sp. NBC_00690 TaxID=2975808 RepID=UPI002E2A0AAC|nr:DUF11 domain-containing protein [Streptomyces sp. NBC_00690]
MRGCSGGLRLKVLAVSAVVLGAQAVAMNLAVPAAHATVPPTPGVPQPPSVLYFEDFEKNTGKTPILLPSHQGAPPLNQTYTADPAWLEPADCNGIVLNQAGGNQPACEARNARGMTVLKGQAKVLGQVDGAADPSLNHVVSAYTDTTDPGANKVEFQTRTPVPLALTGRFITFSVDVAASGCTASAPLLEFHLTGDGRDVPVFSSPIDPCTDARAQTHPGAAGDRIRAGSFPSNGSVLFSGSSLGIKMVNANGSGLGNDHSYDNIRILDATPRLDMEFNPATISANGTSRLTFTITNTTDLAAKNGFGFQDALPVGVVVAPTPNTATTCGAGTVTTEAGGASIALVNGSLATGAPFCTVAVEVTAAREAAYVHPSTYVTPAGLNPPAPATLSVTAPGPSLRTSAAEPSFVVGQEIHYTHTVTNNSTASLSAVAITDDGPGTSTVSCSAATLAPGASLDCTATRTATAADAASGTITSTASVTGTTPDGAELTGTGDRVVIPLRSLAVVKTAAESGFDTAGQEIHYTTRVTNNGLAPLTGIGVTDDGPGTPSVTCPPTVLAPRASMNCLATHTTSAADVTAGGIVGTATATGNSPGGESVTATSRTHTVPHTPQADLSVERSGPATVVAGGVVEYSITVTNHGPSDATGWSLVDPIPVGLADAATTTAGCMIIGTTLTCTGGPLADGADFDIALTGRAAGNATTTIVNTATVDGQDLDPDLSNNEDTTTTEVARSVDLSVERSGPATVVAGGVVEYSITVTNHGPSDATGWSLVDPIPVGLADAATTTAGCTIIGTTLTCTGGPLADGADFDIALTGRAAPDATTIAHTATVDGDNVDPHPENDEDSTTTTVVGSGPS